MGNFREKLCASNIELLTEIEKTLTVEFEAWNKIHWGAKIRNSDKVGIVYYSKEFSNAKVAHELLHLKISLIMENNAALLLEASLHLPHLNRLFHHQVGEHFLNSYEHMKIFEEYKSMGFEDDDFFENDRRDKSISTSLFEIIKNFGGISPKGQYDLTLLGQYICTTIAYLSNPTKNLKKGLKTLERIEKPLFKILKNYWDKILSLPLTDKGKTQMYKEHKNFIMSMDKWISDIKIV